MVLKFEVKRARMDIKVLKLIINYYGWGFGVLGSNT